MSELIARAKRWVHCKVHKCQPVVYWKKNQTKIVSCNCGRIFWSQE